MFALDYDTDNAFQIPEGLTARIPCQSQPHLFWDKALDIDIEDDEWVRLESAEQYARLQAKQSAEAKAVAACGTCPLLDECRSWALAAKDTVYGVVGGLTQEERTGGNTVREIVTDPTLRGPLGQVRDDLIERWSKAGLSNKAIAERLGCNVRTVERRKAGLLNGRTRKFGAPASSDPQVAELSTLTVAVTGRAPVAAPKDAAANALQPQRVSPETAAIFDALMDGGLRDRSTIIEQVIPFVDKETALKTAPAGREYSDEEVQIAVGARKFLMNRIDIAVRRGRIQSITTDSKVLICLDATTAASWRAYRSGEEQASA